MVEGTAFPYVSLPKSTSYLKVACAPCYYVDGPADLTSLYTDITPAMVQQAMLLSPLKDFLFLQGPPCVCRDSPRSTMATYYLNIWNTKCGTHAKDLIGSLFMLRSQSLVIQ